MKKLLILVSALAAMCFAAPVAGAATITVNTTDDLYGGSGSACSLREAITAAQTNAAYDGCTAGSGPDVISLPDGTYKITRAGGGENANLTGDFDVTGTNALTIEPAGAAAKVVIDGNDLDRVIDQQGANQLSLRNVTVKGGKITMIEDGAGLRNSNGELTIDGSTISGNSNDLQQGGGVAVYSQTNVMNSTISGNRTAGNGGGFYIPGGGILTVRSSTITKNVADSDNDGNGHGGGFADGGSTSINMTNTINAANEDRSVAPNNLPDCSSGPFYFPDYVLTTQALGAGGCLVGFNPGTNKVVTDPLLGPLQDNGGQTPTHALLGGSPAIAAGAPTGPDQCPAKDQAGRDRPADACDIGAVQFVTPVNPALSPNLKIGPVKPKVLKVKRGKKAKAVKVTVANVGEAIAPSAKLCLTKTPAVVKQLKVKGKACRSLGTLALQGKKTVSFKFAAKKKAKRKTVKVKVTASATGAAKKTSTIKVKVK